MVSINNAMLPMRKKMLDRNMEYFYQGSCSVQLGNDRTEHKDPLRAVVFLFILGPS